MPAGSDRETSLPSLLSRSPSVRTPPSSAVRPVPLTVSLAFRFALPSLRSTSGPRLFVDLLPALARKTLFGCLRETSSLPFVLTDSPGENTDIGLSPSLPSIFVHFRTPAMETSWRHASPTALIDGEIFLTQESQSCGASDQTRISHRARQREESLDVRRVYAAHIGVETFWRHWGLPRRSEAG
jgi:hypothetical protein